MPEIRPAGVSVQPYQYVKKNPLNIRKVSIPVEQNNQPKGMSKGKKITIATAAAALLGIGALVITRGKAAAKAAQKAKLLADIPPETLIWYADYFNVSLDYIFDRADSPQGKLFDFKPEVIKQMSSQNENLKAFVNMCFDPKSAMNERLKNALFEILSEEKEKTN